MAALGFTSNPLHILPDGIATWKIKSGDDVGHYDLGLLSNARVNPQALFDLDSYRRQRVFAIQVDASARMLNTHKTSVLEKLGLLGVESMNQIITARNAAVYAGTLGFHWRFVCEEDMSRSRYIEVFADGILIPDHASYEDWTDFITSPVAGTPDAGDYLYGLDATNIAGRVPAGFVSVSWTGSGETENMGELRKTKLIVTGEGRQNGYGRSFVNQIHVDLEFEMMQGGHATELGIIDDAVTDAAPGFIVTLADGAVLTLSTTLGMTFEHLNVTDSTDIGAIKVSAGGSIAPGSWAGLIA